MDERQARPGQQSRRAVLRALPTPVDVELYVQDAPPLLDIIGDLPEPRIADLDALLREVDGLRSTLRRDLGLAATAAEAGADELAGWLLLSEDGQVRSFEQRALAHLATLEEAEVADTPGTPGAVDDVPVPAARRAPRRFHRMMPAAPLVAACAALFGFLSGGIPTPTTSPSTANVALDSYARVTDLALRGASDHRISEAAQQFHDDLAPLVAAAGTDPAAAEKAIALLQSERAVLVSTGSTLNSPALMAVLREADALVARLRAGLPRKPVRSRLVVPVAPSEPRAEAEAEPRRASGSPAPAPSASPSASPKPSPSPSASPKASQTSSPAPSSSSSSAPESGSPLPDNPTAPLDKG